MPTPDWQPIETAPKDGTYVMTWNGRWRDVSYWSRRDGYTPPAWHCLCANVNHIDQPTHWMPLPEPPK